MECRAPREVQPISASFAGQHNANVCAMAQISIPEVTYADLLWGSRRSVASQFSRFDLVASS